ncbi:MAG: hypothetical protein ACREO8_10360, partial [Luteimonas sp.]
GFDIALHALPWFGVAAAVAWHVGATAWPIVAALVLVLALATVVLSAHAARKLDDIWLARRLDAQRADMDDSAALLFADAAAAGSALQRLQRQRLQRRLATAAMPDLRPPWRMRSIATSAVAALLVVVAVLIWPSAAPSVHATVTGPQQATGAAALPRLVAQRLAVRPPTYTGLPLRAQSALAATVPAGSDVTWTLRFAPAPMSAALVFIDGTRLPLRRDGDGDGDGDGWTATQHIDRATLYRIALPTALPDAQSRLQRIDVTPDRPPQLHTRQPDRSLSVRAAGQRRWSLLYEAQDDYGLTAAARLFITRTEGSGENIQARTSTLVIGGSGTTTRRRYAYNLDLGAIGLIAGDDLIVQLEVADNRTPTAQRTRSPSVILRWPPQTDAASSGLDGLLTRTMPAYFRSQRQIIIDAEALQKQKRVLNATRFATRSDAIGADQRALRARYSQFLGGEDQGAPTLPTNDDAPSRPEDDHDAHARDGDNHDDDHGHADPAPAPAAAAADDHEHEHDRANVAPPTFGSADSATAEFGHVHDGPEATTLLDPQTRDTLRAALDQMWQSEVNLRVGKPDAALPFAYKALGFIKEVQQATRIYLARTAVAPPPIDETRRLSGDRAGLRDARDALVAATAIDPAPAAAWHALQEAPDDTAAIDTVASGAGARGGATQTSADASASQRTALIAADAAAAIDTLERWALAHPARVADPLALAAAIDALRRTPRCADCRDALRKALWPILVRPPAAVGARDRGNRDGQAYLDALGGSDAPRRDASAHGATR